MFEHSFIHGCLYGLNELEDLDAYVEHWHTHEIDTTLREFLGMTQKEYEEWLKAGDVVIRDILRCRVDGTPFEDYQYMTAEQKIAARSYSIEEIDRLRNDDKHGGK